MYMPGAKVRGDYMQTFGNKGCNTTALHPTSAWAMVDQVPLHPSNVRDLGLLQTNNAGLPIRAAYSDRST